MKRIYTCDDLLQAGHIRSLLLQQGIGCHVRNESLSGAIGEIPPIECWPEIWISNDDDAVQAQAVIDAALAPASHQPAWRCRCGEELEGQFSQCWNCGAERESALDANV